MSPEREAAIRAILTGGTWPCRTCGRRHRNMMSGPKIRIMREGAGLSQAALGAAAGISQGRVSEIERRLRPLPLELAESLLVALGAQLPD